MAKKAPSREEMLARVRKKMQEKSVGRRDPDEFRCPTAKKDQTLEYYFKVLPELQAGSKCSGGEAPIDMDLWYYENGAHFIGGERIECPRCHDRTACPICQLGFDMMEGSEDKEYRSRISRAYLGRSYYAVNIYFINHQKNPENLRGRVMWYNAPKTVWDKWDACIHNDDPGDKDEPRACGLFFEPLESTYVFKLEATLKNEYNNYETSKFLPATLGPLVKLSNGQPDEEAIEKIMSQRHFLPKKFVERNRKKLEEQAAFILKKEGGGGNEEGTEEISIGESAVKTIKDTPKAAPKAAPKDDDMDEAPRDKKQEIIEEPLEKPKTTPSKNVKLKPKEVKKDELGEIVEESSGELEEKQKEEKDESDDLKALLSTIESED